MNARMMAVSAVAAFLLAAGEGVADITIEMVPVGNVGNVGELSGLGAGTSGVDRICGAVDYKFNIGTYEVTAGQYTAFLTAVAGVDTYALYTGRMSLPDGSGIGRSGGGTVGAPYTYTVDPAFANRPVNYVTWGDAARFTNWLTNGQPTGAQGPGTTETGSYALDGAMTREALLAVTRIAEVDRVAGQEYYFIPSEDEWYKAAYYDSESEAYFDYPTSSSIVPGRDMADASGNNANYYLSSDTPWPIDSPYYTTLAGEFQNSESPYGTFDQGGNVWEWNEAVVYYAGWWYRGLRGGSFWNTNGYSSMLASFRDDHNPADARNYTGFRVSQVPEPATALLLALGGLALIRRRRR